MNLVYFQIQFENCHNPPGQQRGSEAGATLKTRLGRIKIMKMKG